MNPPLYFDYNATTPIDPRVLDAMLPYLRSEHGNPSSSHAYGLRARSGITSARSAVASLIGARDQEMVFTASGSESNNLAIKGVVFSQLSRRPHVVTTAGEHPSVLVTLRYLEQRFGLEVKEIAPNGGFFKLLAQECARVAWICTPTWPAGASPRRTLRIWCAARESSGRAR